MSQTTREPRYYTGPAVWDCEQWGDPQRIRISNWSGTMDKSDIPELIRRLQAFVPQRKSQRTALRRSKT